MPQAHLVQANGAAIPAIGFGTWQLTGDTCRKAVEFALEAGYRHLDTAAMYGNEEEVGAALKSSGLARDAIFLTTKVRPDEVAPGQLERAAEASVKRLGVDQVDLLLIHWPRADLSAAEMMKGLCAAKRQGLARHVGVSNFPSALLREAIALSSEPLVTNQCEYHPYLNQHAVLAACRENGVAFTSYSPLGRGKMLEEPVIVEIATLHGKPASQVVLRWQVQQPGIVAIPRSSGRDHIVENIGVFDFALSDDEMARISALARPGGRVVSPAWAPHWDEAA